MTVSRSQLSSAGGARPGRRRRPSTRSPAPTRMTFGPASPGILVPRPPDAPGRGCGGRILGLREPAPPAARRAPPRARRPPPAWLRRWEDLHVAVQVGDRRAGRDPAAVVRARGVPQPARRARARATGCSGASWRRPPWWGRSRSEKARRGTLSARPGARPPGPGRRRRSGPRAVCRRWRPPGTPDRARDLGDERAARRATSPFAAASRKRRSTSLTFGPVRDQAGALLVERVVVERVGVELRDRLVEVVERRRGRPAPSPSGPSRLVVLCRAVPNVGQRGRGGLDVGDVAGGVAGAVGAVAVVVGRGRRGVGRGGRGRARVAPVAWPRVPQTVRPSSFAFASACVVDARRASGETSLTTASGPRRRRCGRPRR